MVQRVGSIRRKTRNKMSKTARERGKMSLTRYFAEYNEGDKVTLKAEPAYQKGCYHPRFHGKTGSVVGKTGRCFRIKFNDQGKDKVLIVHPVHLIRKA